MLKTLVWVKHTIRKVRSFLKIVVIGKYQNFTNGYDFLGPIFLKKMFWEIIGHISRAIFFFSTMYTIMLKHCTLALEFGT